MFLTRRFTESSVSHGESSRGFYVADLDLHGQKLTSHEDQNDTLKPDHPRRDGGQPKSPRPVTTRFPLVITSSGTPHPHQPEPEAHPTARVRPHRRPRVSRLGYPGVIAVARSRDGDPLT
jgi:hypothetical protein